MVRSTVWLNGILLGGHASGYTPFHFELGIGSAARPYINFDSHNTVVVKADATKPDGWWYDGGGIYRGVKLTTVSPIHIAPWGVYAPAHVRGHVDRSYFTADAEVAPVVTIRNAGLTGTNLSVVSILQEVDRPAQIAMSSAATVLPPGASSALKLPLMRVLNASLWTLQRPTLYRLILRVSVLHSQCATTEENTCSQQVDSESVTIGIRSSSWSPDTGFELNGVRTKILGCANHQDFPAVGVAVPDSMQEYRLHKLKEIGANAWRTAHNPPNTALLDAADRLGMLVWDENHRNGQDHEMEMLILRDRNHPSIIIWSLCNEALCSTDNMV